jgi:hypothetical protein
METRSAALPLHLQTSGLSFSLMCGMEIVDRRPTDFVLIDPEGYRTKAALTTWDQQEIDFLMTLPAMASWLPKRRRKAISETGHYHI